MIGVVFGELSITGILDKSLLQLPEFTIYKRVISTALWEKGMFKPEGLRANALFEFKKLVYDGKGIDPTFKEELLKRLNINISHARRTGRVKGKRTEEILERKYIRVLDVLKRYCNNSG